MLVFILFQLACAFYAENLDIKPLSNNELFSTFNFTMQQAISPIPPIEYSIFPRSLGEILQSTMTSELHIRFGHGVWDSDSWGALPQNGLITGGSGVEIWAFISAADQQHALRQWNQLVNQLSGYFCASMGFADETVVTFPSMQAMAPRGGNMNTILMRASLPAEPVCTENLTPFLKLLPCRNKAGLSTMLSGNRVFASKWQTMSVDVFPFEEELRLEQIVSLVSDVKRNFTDPLPYPELETDLDCDSYRGDGACFPVKKSEVAFNLTTIFGYFERDLCILGDAKIKVDLPVGWTVNNETKYESILDETIPELEFVSNGKASFDNLPPPFIVDRSFSGYGMQNGGVRVVITNNRPYPINVRYLESWPHFVKLFMHTLSLGGNGTIVNKTYLPSLNKNSAFLELELEIVDSIVLEFEFEKSLLLLEEYPPDANHGFEISPALTILKDGDYVYEDRTPSMLLPLPVPDFSMPYNVVILTSTVMGLAFGTIYNLLVRDVVPLSQVPVHSENLLQKVLKKIK